jgi:hypothetical protein
MEGVERQYLRECINALCEARTALMELKCKDAVTSGSYGKSDTLLLDDRPEMVIIDVLSEFDSHLPMITEEIGANKRLEGREDEFVCFCDPMDRSKVLSEFLARFPAEQVATVFQDSNVVREWESEGGGNVELTGPYGSITAIRHRQVLFNVMINYITGVVYVASDQDVGSLPASEIYADGDRRILKRSHELIRMLQPITFDERRAEPTCPPDSFVAYCRDQRYLDNLLAANIFVNENIKEICDKHLAYDRPGGPARILYLKDPSAVGFILANGEKIGEWLGWLAYVRFLWPKLRAFELSFDSSWTKDQILMSPGQAYSILGDQIGVERGRCYKIAQINMPKLRFLDDPSRYRSTILICPESNRAVIMSMYDRKCPELRFTIEDEGKNLRRVFR